MIHYVTIDHCDKESVRFSNNDGSDKCGHDGVTAVDLTVARHFGIRIFDNPEGRTFIELSEGGTTAESVPVEQLIRANM